MGCTAAPNRCPPHMHADIAAAMESTLFDTKGFSFTESMDAWQLIKAS